MNLKIIFKKSSSILKPFKLQIFSAVTLSIFSALSGGLSIGILLPIIDSNPEYVIEQLGLGFLNDFLEQININDDIERLRFFAFLIIIITIFETILTVSASFISINISSEIVLQLQRKLINKYYLLDQKYRNNIDNGYAFSLISENSKRIGEFFGQLLNSTKNVFIMIIYGYVLIRVSFIMTVSAFFLLGVFSILIKAFFGKKLKRQSEKTIISVEELNKSLIENLRNSKYIKGSGRKSDFQGRLTMLLKIYKSNYIKRQKITALSGPIFNTINAVSIALLLILGTYFLNLPLDQWLPLMVPFIIIIFRLVGPINQLNSMRIKLEGVVPDLIRVINFTEKSEEKDQSEGEVYFENFEKEIKLSDISFKYDGDREFNLKISNLRIQKNTSTALIGPSGGGKSTIIELLMKIYKYDSGEISIDDIDLNKIENSSWQQKIAYVNQEPIVFNTTLRNNLTWFNPEATEKELIKVAKNAQIYDFIKELDGGFDYVFKDNGSGLSGGQKQRIAIARALLINAQILVFDEATSQIDIEAESSIYSLLESLQSQLTIIIVAHRLTAIRNVDKIVIISKGRVIGEGSPDDLSSYSNFYSDSLSNLSSKGLNK